MPVPLPTGAQVQVEAPPIPAVATAAPLALVEVVDFELPAVETRAPEPHNLTVVPIQGPPGPRNRVATIESSATPIINVATTDHYDITALADDAAISITGIPGLWQTLWVTVHAGATQSLTWDPADFDSSGVAAWPASVAAGKTVTAAGKYNPALGKFICMAVDVIGY